MERVIELAKLLKLDSVQLTVLKANKPAVEFYSKWGFVPAEWSPLDEDEDYNYYIYILQLNETNK